MKIIVSVRDIFIRFYELETFGYSHYNPITNEIKSYKFLQEWGVCKGGGISDSGIQSLLDRGGEFYLVEDTPTKKIERYMLNSSFFRFFKREELKKLNSLEEIFAVCEECI